MFALGQNVMVRLFRWPLPSLWAKGFKPASCKTIEKRLDVQNQKLNLEATRFCLGARWRGGTAGSRFEDTNVEVPSTRC